MDSNPGPIFSIPGFVIETFLILVSRRDFITTRCSVFHARSASPLGRNFVLCCLRYGRTFGQLIKQKWKHQFCDAQSLYYFSQDDYSYIRSILELLMIRDDVLHVGLYLVSTGTGWI